MNDQENEKEFNRLLELSKQAEKEADAYERLANEARKNSADLEARAVELASPFKRGDIIEFQKVTGFNKEPKTFRMRVDYLSVTWDSAIEARGRQVTIKGELSRNQQWVIFNGSTKFIKVIKRAE